MEVPDELVRQTYFWDRFRGAAQGVQETGYMGLALVIAIEVFDAPAFEKSLIVAAQPTGLLLTPLTLGLIAWLHQPANKVASFLLFASAIGMGVATLAHSLNAFLIPLIVSAILGTQSLPLMAHIYVENYPSNRRGAYLSVSFMFSVTTTLLFSLLLGHLLDLDPGYYTMVLGTLCAATFLCGLAVGKMPSSPIHQKSSQNPLRSMSYAFTDWKFGIMLFSWMFLGLGNLMVMPLRFEYLIQPQYGIEASKLMVAWLTLGLPAVFRFVSAKFWGRLFDRIDFMVLRMIVNILQMVSIFLFFFTRNYWLLGFSSILMGIGMGGGKISWSLWVTKFAPRDRTAAYMSVHTFLTGVRGFAAPFLGFYLLATYGSKNTGGIGAAMILVSIIMVFALYRVTRKRGTRRPSEQAM